MLNHLRTRLAAAVVAIAAILGPAVPSAHASEANLVLPKLSEAKFGGINGQTLLTCGLVICIAGLAFGLVIYKHLKQLPVHRAMLEVSELIYQTCKTYLKTQGKFILVLWCFIASIMVVYFGFLNPPTKNPENLVPVSTPWFVVIILL